MIDQSRDFENRLMLLEEKLEFQDYTIEKLNEVLISQQRQIDSLEDTVVRLREKMESHQLEAVKTPNDPPPHY